MPIDFRPAHVNDVETAIALIYSSGPEAFEYGFTHDNDRSQDFLRFAFSHGLGFLGWRNHTVALVDDSVVGIGAFYSGKDYLRLSIGMVWQVLCFYPLPTVPRVIMRLLQLQALMPAPGRDTYYVAHFAVLANQRSQGVGSALLSYQQSVARRLGFKKYALDVAIDNPKALALYQRLGFKQMAQQRFPGRIGQVPDTLRMEMDC